MVLEACNVGKKKLSLIMTGEKLHQIVDSRNRLKTQAAEYIRHSTKVVDMDYNYALTFKNEP
jgi:hypothetical protein